MHAKISPLEAIVAACLVVGIVVAVSTELLSLAHELTRPAVAAAWSAALAAALAARPWRHVARPTLPPGIVILALPVALLTLVVAIAAPPNTWDSQTYHMARVWHWAQRGTVAFYPTHILRQLHQAPWAEYAILHLQLLAGDDRLANLVQWASMAGCMAGVALIAGDLGASRAGQGLAVVAAATIPAGALEASSTQTDYAVALWLVCLAAALRRLVDVPGPRRAAAAGAALGLALLAKGTAYLYAAPLVAWAGLALLRCRPAAAIRLGALAAGVALALNAGHYARTAALYGSPLGPGSEGAGVRTPGDLRYASDLHTPAALLSGVVRNLALHAAPPEAAEAAVVRAHAALGIAPDDPRTTWAGRPFTLPPILPPHEDSAPAPLHLGLALLAGAVSLRRPRARPYALALLAGALLFACYLRWQPWHARLHLPLFVLAAPLIGLALGGAGARAQHLAGALLLLAALPALLLGMPRPILGPWSALARDREAQRYAGRPELQGAYESAAAAIARSGCRDVGLVLGFDDWEYPLLALLRPGVHVRHVRVANVSARIAEDGPAPCLMAAWDGATWTISPVAGGGPK